MKKKLLAAFGVAAAMCLCFAMVGCGGNSAPAASSSSDSAEVGPFIVGFDSEYPPYGYGDDNGDYTGVDLDLAKEVCDRNGWEFKAEPIDWDAKDALLDAGTITCIWNGFTMSDDRLDKYAWSEPYMHNAQVVIVKADSDVKTLADLADKHVMTQVESAGLEALEQEQYADIVKTFAGGAPETLDKFDNIMMQLEAGTIDACVGDLSIAALHMAKKPDTFKVVETLSEEQFGIGFKLGNEEMAQKVTATLKEMTADGTVEKILKNYEDQAVTMENWLLK